MGAAPSKTTKEILNENKSAIRQSIREIDREERQIKRRQREVETTIKRSAKAGRIVSFVLFLLCIERSKDICKGSCPNQKGH